MGKISAWNTENYYIQNPSAFSVHMLAEFQVKLELTEGL